MFLLLFYECRFVAGCAHYGINFPVAQGKPLPNQPIAAVFFAA
jgi:hypothetical protein